MMWMLTFWDVIAIYLHVLETQHMADAVGNSQFHIQIALLV